MGDDLIRRPSGSARQSLGPGYPAESVILEQDFDFGSLYSLRAAVAAHGAAAGLAGPRLYDVVTSAHELAATAVRHGAGRGRLRLWILDGVLHCEVSDDGRDRAADADQSAPWKQVHGHGLWVVSQVADQFTIDRSDAATTATAVFTLGAAAGPDAPDVAGDLAWPGRQPAPALPRARSGRAARISFRAARCPG